MKKILCIIFCFILLLVLLFTVFILIRPNEYTSFKVYFAFDYLGEYSYVNMKSEEVINEWFGAAEYPPPDRSVNLNGTEYPLVYWGGYQNKEAGLSVSFYSNGEIYSAEFKDRDRSVWEGRISCENETLLRQQAEEAFADIMGERVAYDSIRIITYQKNKNKEFEKEADGFLAQNGKRYYDVIFSLTIKNGNEYNGTLHLNKNGEITGYRKSVNTEFCNLFKDKTWNEEALLRAIKEQGVPQLIMVLNEVSEYKGCSPDIDRYDEISSEISDVIPRITHDGDPVLEVCVRHRIKCTQDHSHNDLAVYYVSLRGF